MICTYPDCSCEVSFPGGYKPSDATECPKCVFDLAWDILCVNLSDLSRSYPFLDLSRKMDAPYEDVLRLADIIDAGAVNEKDLETSLTAQTIAAVCRAPWRWQYPPQGRGL